MADIVSAAQRSKIMSRIRGENTRPELIIRRAMHLRGFRYRLHVSQLPGKPDMVFRKFKAVVFINGCFWHGHDCSLFREPKSNAEFWHLKITRNRENDKKNLTFLEGAGWRVMTIWECAIRGNCKDIDKVIDKLILWLKSNETNGTIRS